MTRKLGGGGRDIRLPFQRWNLTLALRDQNIGRTMVDAPASHPAGNLIKIP